MAGVWGGCTNCVKHGTSRAHLFDLSSLRGLHKSSPPPPRARGSSVLAKIKTGIHLLGRYFLISISRNFHFLRPLESEYVPNVSLAYLVPFARFRQGVGWGRLQFGLQFDFRPDLEVWSARIGFEGHGRSRRRARGVTNFIIETENSLSKRKTLSKWGALA